MAQPMNGQYYMPPQQPAPGNGYYGGYPPGGYVAPPPYQPQVSLQIPYKSYRCLLYETFIQFNSIQFTQIW